MEFGANFVATHNWKSNEESRITNPSRMCRIPNFTYNSIMVNFLWIDFFDSPNELEFTDF